MSLTGVTFILSSLFICWSRANSIHPARFRKQ